MRETTARAWRALLADYRNVCVYTADPGGHAMVRELVPLLRDMDRLGEWFAEGWSAGQLPQCRSGAEVPAALATDDALLLGSQVNYERTHAILRDCQALGVTTIFLFDHWKNYSKHFGAGPLPDVVVVPDDDARTELIAEYGGTVARRVRILPHLAIEASVDRIRSLNIPVESGTVAMLLDPTEAADNLGYDWRRELHAAADQAAASAFARLLVKPHPRQDPAVVQRELTLLAGNGVATVLYGGETERLIAVAQEVWGMTTVALNIALGAGKRIRSFQIGRNAAGVRASNRQIEPYVVS